MAAPILVAQVTGSDARSTVSKEYGGKGVDVAAARANPVYNAIGQVHFSATLLVCQRGVFLFEIHHKP